MAEGNEMIILEAMKMQNVLPAPKDAKVIGKELSMCNFGSLFVSQVKAVKCKAGDTVLEDEVLVELE